MWPYNDDENGWLAQKSAEPAPFPAYDYHTPAPQLTPELMAFHRQRAEDLRNQAISAFFGSVARIGAETFRHLSMISSGNRAKIESAIAELRHQAIGSGEATPRNLMPRNLMPPNAATAGR